jgi:hypothetical protein
VEEAGLNKWGRDFLRRFQPPPDEKEAQRGVRERRFGRNLLIMATIAIAHYNDAGACDRDNDGVTDDYRPRPMENSYGTRR